MQKFLLLLTSLFLVCACKSQQKATSLNEYENNIISFGSGGGFTGEEITYLLLENGQIFLSKGLVTKTTTMFSSISKTKSKLLFEKASKIDWTKPEINAPGNMYYTLSFGKKNEMIKQIWGNNEENPSKEILNLYEELIKTITKK